MNCSEYVTQLVQNNISQVDNFNKLYEKFVEIVGERCEMNNVPAHICTFCYCLLVNASTLSCGHTHCTSCLRYRDVCWCGSTILRSTKNSLKRNIVLGNTVQQLFPSASDNVIKLSELEQKYSAEGVLLQAVDELKDEIDTFKLPKHVSALIKARHYLARREYSIAASHARRAIKYSPSLATGWCFLSEILAKQEKYIQSLARLLVVHWLDPNLPHSVKLCEEVFCLAQLHVTKNKASISNQKAYQTPVSLELLAAQTSDDISESAEDNQKDNITYNPVTKKARYDTEVYPEEERPSNGLTVDQRANRVDYDTIQNMAINPSDNKMTPVEHSCVVNGKIAVSKRSYPSHSSVLSFSKNQGPENEKSVEFLSKAKDVVDECKMDILPSKICSVEILKATDEVYIANIKLPLRAGDLECPLCLRIYWEPDVTPCGHTYCSNCLERTLDHDPKCPLCKHSLTDYYECNREQKNYDSHLMLIIKRWLPVEYDERFQAAKEDEEEMQRRLPIFVCTLAFPCVPCPLHVFEPRHRLLLRRCMRNRKGVFGMNLPRTQPGDIPFERIGTKLKVRKANYFHDGRVVVDSIGVGRFKVKDVNQVDGYDSANCDQIIDTHPRPSEMNKLLSLSNTVFSRATEWFESLPDDMSAALTRHFGDMPERSDEADQYQLQDGPSWPWWVLAVIPAEDRIKMHVLSQTSLLKRLSLMARVITCITNSAARPPNQPPE